MQERRRRSGALHANTCEEYLKKYENMGKVLLIESQRRNSINHDAFSNFDFVPEDSYPLDNDSDEIIQIKILIYSPKMRINEDEFIQLMKRVRGRSVTSDGIQQRNTAVYDFDFFYKEYTINEKTYGLHFWVQNSNKHQYTHIFQGLIFVFMLANYYNKFHAAILFQRDLNLESIIKSENPKCFIKYFPVLDELLVEPLQSVIIEICQFTINS